MKIGQNLVIIVSFKPLFAQKIEVRKKGEKMDLQVCRVVTFSTPLLMTLQSSRHLPNCVTRSLGHLANMVFCWYYGYYTYSRRNLVMDIFHYSMTFAPFGINFVDIFMCKNFYNLRSESYWHFQL